ncbi:hypothetical protein [Thermoleptolyngbya sp. C42_A2020_037]|uniref:hypothetical protein n=1 Tax=Thermoleptolyngbya sp. C42_A2020_037 TaxID=2747799 RepID=UPI0019F1E3CD|nr:hypothetical protein [Thermoleptolyngbya sp. C42_A2020_037]MBF2086060.1 hypothetical protein [Thermoleptolyngbya sp. C42_A2020_037]
MALQPIPTTPSSIMGRSLVRRSLLTACAALSTLGVALDSAIASVRVQAEPLRGISQMPVRVMKLCHLGSREEQLQAAVVQYLNRHNIPAVSNPRGQPVATPRYVISIECTDDGGAISVRGSVFHNVQLNGRTIEAGIYSSGGGYGSLGYGMSYSQAERELLTGLLDTFIRDWRSTR